MRLGQFAYIFGFLFIASFTGGASQTWAARSDSIAYLVEVAPAVVGCAEVVRKLGRMIAPQVDCSVPADKRLIQARIGARETIRALVAIDHALGRSGEREIRIRAERLRVGHDTEPEKLEWRLKPGTPDEDSTFIAKRLNEFMAFDRYINGIKAGILAEAVDFSSDLKKTADGTYVESATGKKLATDEAYAHFAAESSRNHNWLRAFLETAGMMGYGIFQYYVISHTVNAEDYDFPWDLSTLRKKILFQDRSWSTDTNPIDTNIVSHPFSGQTYVAVARANGLSTLESFLFAFTVSALWEVVIEYRERVSINDQIMTPLSGLAVGEAFYQLGKFFNDGKSGFAKVLGWIFGTPDAFHRFLDGVPRRSDAEFDALGFPRDRWHALEVASMLGTMVGTPDGKLGTVGQLSLVARLVNLPNLGTEGEAQGWVKNTASVDFQFEKDFDTSGANELQFLTRVALAGYHLYKNRGGSGYSVFIGAATGFEFNSTYDNMPGGDKLKESIGVVNILGPTLEMMLFHKGILARLRVDVFGDYACVHSYALQKYSESHSIEAVQTVLREQKYYFAYGMTLAAKATVAYGLFEWGADVRMHEYASLSAGDRFPETATAPVNARDTIANVKVWQDFTIPLPEGVLPEGTSFKLRLTVFDQRFRKGSIEDVTRSNRFRQFMLGAAFSF